MPTNTQWKGCRNLLGWSYVATVDGSCLHYLYSSTTTTSKKACVFGAGQSRESLSGKDSSGSRLAAHRHRYSLIRRMEVGWHPDTCCVDFHDGLSQSKKKFALNVEPNKLGPAHCVCGSPWRNFRCKPRLSIRRKSTNASRKAIASFMGQGIDSRNLGETTCAHADPAGCFKKCCLKIGHFDGSDRHHYSR